MEYKHREKLTVDLMKREIKEQVTKGLWHSLIAFIIILPIMLFFLFSFIKFNASIVIMVIMVSPFAVILIVCIYVVLKSLRVIRLITKRKYIVTVDKLIGFEDKKSIRGSSFTSFFSKPYKLHFATYGVYYIPENENYKWSKMYNMDDKGVFDSSSAGDEFYLFIINKDIFIAYNKKMFDLQ